MINQKIVDRLLLPENIASTRILLKHNLKHFIKFFHFVLTKQQFIFKDFHIEVIKVLQDIVFNKAEKQHLVINIAPRFGKSIICQYLCSWGYSINKNSNDIYTSYSDNLVLKFSKKIRDIVSTDEFRKLFNIQISKSEESKRLWSIENGGSFYAVSIAGAVTGSGAGVMEDIFGGFLIIDDASKPEDTKSEIMRQKVIEYFDETLMNRLNNPQKTPIIVIAQRLHQQDICGHIEKKYKKDFKILKFSVLDEENNISIWQEKYPVEKLLSIKNTNPFYFYSQYQQTPIISGGTILKEKWLKYYTELPELDKIYQSWDTAFKTKENNDYSVGTTWGVKKTKFGEDYYLINLCKKKLEYSDLKDEIIKQNNTYNPINILIEDKASGQSICQELIKKYNMKNIKPIQVPYRQDKEDRLFSVISLFESGRVYFDKNANYLSDLIGELITFPNGTHDDIVDSITQFLNFITTKPKLIIR